MFLSMNWISDFVDLSGLDKLKLINQFSLSTAEVENEIFFKGEDLSGVVVAEIKSVEPHPDSKKRADRRCLRRTECKSRNENCVRKGRRKAR